MRPIELQEHPIFNPMRFRINTPAIEALRRNLTRLVWTGATGAALLGFTRAGKTIALELLGSSLQARNGHAIPVITYATHRRDKHTIRALYENIHSHLNLEYKRSTGTERLCSHLLMHLAEIAKAHHANQLVMMIDEAQRLAIPQIDLFAELDDRMRKEYSISLMAVFVGNLEQMGRLLDEVHKGENEHIEGRFFRQTFRFTGLRSVDDVRFCLAQYDTRRYPENGPTYTENFLEHAYANGFRLVSLAQSIWGEFALCRKELHIDDWAMEYFVRAVNILLTDYLPKFGTHAYSDEMFHRCIDVSGLYPDMVLEEAQA